MEGIDVLEDSTLLALEEGMRVDTASLSCQAGYLPIPLACVPAEGLRELHVYLRSEGAYCLYACDGGSFTEVDRQRLLNNSVVTVYVPVRDHQRYYRAMENSLVEIVAEPSLQRERKAEIFYSTALELANDLLAGPPSSDTVARGRKVGTCLVDMIMQDHAAFSSLFDVSNHDFYTATHMINVCMYSVALAQKMGLDNKQLLRELGIGALLHDIGKVFVPSEILNTTGRLSPEQYEITKTHVARGYEHLKSLSAISMDALAAVVEHHERLDGKGYPNGLSGSQLSQMGLIVAVGDTFDAMTSVRPYRDNSFSIEQALKALDDEAQTRYDADAVRAMTELINSEIVESIPDIDGHGASGGRLLRKQPVRQQRRRHERHYFRTRLTVRQAKRCGEKVCLMRPEQLVSHNISRSGIAFLSPHSFELDTSLFLRFRGCSKGEERAVMAVVIRNHHHDNGWHTVGAQFHEVQNDSVVDSIRSSGSTD